MVDYPQYDDVYRINEDWLTSDRGMAVKPSA